MMANLISVVTDWPVIVQGALGSAAFWLILLVCQKLASAINEKYSHHSKQSRISKLYNMYAKYHAFQPNEYSECNFFLLGLLYRLTRPLIKAALWLCIGLLMRPYLEIASSIGFVGSMFYLFYAYEMVKPYGGGVDLKKEEDKVVKELQSLGELEGFKRSSDSE
ncbi:hypothetical protein ACCH75_004619 [Vibrio parahaemolyticus]|uniref:hypothetical protein n=3 Tax=Vibrio parahaemolyticus TaxID=670 RepID=UPI001120AE1D|nr:hypothetical protein [Vibrio parahaemolyticus]EGR3456682.1 hypothetical protein [Vibrio parahaemolyticus]ELJ8865973.1 hypothetical protein [Vibrio parahaemolyticus]MEA5248085.1 hypothetical protein [Vibrio parahaemolyticus]MQC32944.1 hypothetical protein [Vibrio parahaemolyticus]TOF75119.1 hypothetical protein CGJ16_21015 [Vibrio parahaemolyticus]